MSKQNVFEDLPVIRQLSGEILHESDPSEITRLGGLTNHTYSVTLHGGKKYVIRIPGEGTEEMIVRSDEKTSTQLACSLGIDAELLYFGDDGAKVTAYIDGAVTMSSETIKHPERIAQIAAVFRKLHNCGQDTGVPFEVFAMAANYEKIILDNHVALFADYASIKNQVMQIKSAIDMLCHPEKVPCHNDPLCENWVLADNGTLYLIDWEYAGMNDGMWDIADVSIEAEFDDRQDELFLTEYLCRTPGPSDKKHFLANKIYVDYLWTLWAKTRVPFDGQPMEDWAAQRYDRLKGNIQRFLSL